MSFTIKELAALSGIKPHTIRIWEQRYHFLKPARTATNIRTYSNEELKTLLTVALLHKYGFKISRIDHMPEAQRHTAIWQLEGQEAKNEHVVNQLIGHMVDLDAFAFEQALNGHITKYGLRHTLQDVLFPFLDKVGILWQTDRINPAHEHIVSAIIRQKLIAAIELLPASPQPPAFLLFLPEGEYHELGLLVVYYLLKQRGHPVLYLGANVPLTDVAYAARAKQPPFVYTHITAAPRHFHFQKYMAALRQHIPAASLLVSGKALASYRQEEKSHMVLFQSFADVTTYIDSI